MKSLLVLTLLAVFLVSSAFADGVLQGVPKATSDSRTITLHWLTGDESGVTGFEIARRSGMEGSSFIVVFDRVSAKGNNSIYDVVDETAFRTNGSFYQYRIVALYADGRRSDPYFVGVTHSVSSVRRTWGSIKAMFR
jgi:hypothetical protein